ncbi:MAG TPA: PstS family phosphate ABC transporter substrate-binding protein [Dongiaceae bacterium]|nr:PstS family phosphate ABC transporter substrate-binding protein [Dongiaceae bacterium]
MKRMSVALAALAGLATTAGAAEARDQIHIVGSSTVFPFTTAVAENFGKAGKFKTPVVESTGTGGGFKLFCAGVGEDTPDISDASRPIKDSEIATCRQNGVTAIAEIVIGYDGIALANSKSGPAVNLTRKQIWLALARQVPVDGKLVDNPYRAWSEIDPGLPGEKIKVLGPPPTSGTRDAFVELVMDVGCADFPEIKALEGDARKTACAALREDGGYVEAGENDNLIVQKLESNAAAFGIFGYSYLEQNADRIQGAQIEGVAPSFETVADKSYPIGRELFIYVKNAHVGIIPGMREFVAEYVSDRSLGEDGYLADKGLITLAPDMKRQLAAKAMALSPMN